MHRTERQSAGPPQCAPSPPSASPSCCRHRCTPPSCRRCASSPAPRPAPSSATSNLSSSAPLAIASPSNTTFRPVLKRRIEAGDLFDVAILPPDVADGLAQRGRLVAASRVDLGRTGLGVAVRKDTPIPNIDTVDAFRSALLAAPTVAYADGGASSVRIRAILKRLGIAEAMEGKLGPYPSGAAVAALAHGEADLVLIGVTPILQVPAVTLAGRLPAELQTYIVFTGSIGTAAKEPQAARTLLNLLTSPEGIALFKAQGFEPAAGP